MIVIIFRYIRTGHTIEQPFRSEPTRNNNGSDRSWRSARATGGSTDGD